MSYPGTKWHPGIRTGLHVRIEKEIQRSGLAELAKAVENIRPAPCDRCRHRERCASELLACNDFGRYVGAHWKRTGRCPTRELYIKAMKA